MLTLLGIPNCDTVKKARVYLENSQVAFQFRDLRKQPLSESEWQDLIAQDLEGKLINTRSPSFRKTGFKAAELNEVRKLEVLLAQPTAMKRPALIKEGRLLANGFEEGRYDAILKETLDP